MRWLRPPPRFQQLLRRSSPLFRNTILLTVGVCVLIAGVSLSRVGPPQAVPVFAPERDNVPDKQENNLVAAFFHWLPLDFKQVLSYGFPFLAHVQEKEEKEPLEAGSVWERFVHHLTRVNLSDPRSILSGQLLLWGQVDLPKPEVGHKVSPAPGKLEIMTVNPTPSPSRRQTATSRSVMDPRVAIFHTHTSETFLPLHCKTHIYDEVSGIVQAGEMLARALEDRGIPVLHDRTPHDFEVHRKAYSNATTTITNILTKYPDLEIIIDLHRDAPVTSPEESWALTTTRLENKDVARVLLVVGTDQLGLEHPNWRANHRFALTIHRKIEMMYPGLSRGVRLSKARYNQHLSPRMLLVELGGVQNTMEEVALGAEYLADVLATVLEE